MSDVPEGACDTFAIDVWSPFGFVSEAGRDTCGGVEPTAPRWHCRECSVDLASAAKTRKHFAVQHLDYAPYGCAFAGCTVARFCRRKLADHIVAHRHGPRHSFRYDEHLVKRTRLAHMVRDALVKAGEDTSPGLTHLAITQPTDASAPGAPSSINYLAAPQSHDGFALEHSASQAVTTMRNETVERSIMDSVGHADSPAAQSNDTLMPRRSTPNQSSACAAVACSPLLNSTQIDTNNQPQQDDNIAHASSNTAKTEIDEQETIDIEIDLLEKNEALAEANDASSASTLSHLTSSPCDDLESSRMSDRASTRELPMLEELDQENDVSADESICTADNATLNSTSMDAALLDLFSPSTESQSVIMATPAAWAGMTVEVLPNGGGYVMLFPEEKEGECVHGRGCQKRPCQEAVARSRHRLPVPAAVEAEAVHVVRRRLRDIGRTATMPKLALVGQLLHAYALRIIEYFELPCPGPARPVGSLTTRPPKDCCALEDFALMQPEPVATAYAMAVRHLSGGDAYTTPATAGASTDLLGGLAWDDQLRAFRRAIASTSGHFRHQREPLRAPSILRARERRRSLHLEGATEQAENTTAQPQKKKRKLRL